MFNWFPTIQPSINSLVDRLIATEVALREVQERLDMVEGTQAPNPQPGRDLALGEYSAQFHQYSPTEELLLQEVIGTDVITHMSGNKAEVQDYMASTWIAAKPPQFYVTQM